MTLNADSPNDSPSSIDAHRLFLNSDMPFARSNIVHQKYGAKKASSNLERTFEPRDSLVNFAHFPNFVLDSGHCLDEVTLAYQTWGKLNENKNNCIVILHSLTSGTDADSWWRCLFGAKKVFDPQRLFIICPNALGSPYGSSSPLAINTKTGRPYGPDFPLTTIRDDVRLQLLLLQSLGVEEVYCVVGGSLGGMHALEYPLIAKETHSQKIIVKSVVSIAAASQSTAWSIGWNSIQRQIIQMDPEYNSGFYPAGEGPEKGVASARMIAMMTYRTPLSFGKRFGRKEQQRDPAQSRPLLYRGETLQKDANSPTQVPTENNPMHTLMPFYAVQSYLSYQGSKFTKRFDANCYLHLLDKMDTHDIWRKRFEDLSHDAALADFPPTLILGVKSDILFPTSEQLSLASSIPKSTFAVIESMNGHDGFLIEKNDLANTIGSWLQEGVNFD